jgi:hypothetical protein
MLETYRRQAVPENFTLKGPLAKGFAKYAVSRMSPDSYYFFPVPTAELALLLSMRFRSAAIRNGKTIRLARGLCSEEDPTYGLHVWCEA